MSIFARLLCCKKIKNEYLTKLSRLSRHDSRNLVESQWYFSDISTNVDLTQYQNFFQLDLFIRTQSQQLSDNGNNLFVFREQLTFFPVNILKIDGNHEFQQKDKISIISMFSILFINLLQNLNMLSLFCLSLVFSSKSTKFAIK